MLRISILFGLIVALAVVFGFVSYHQAPAEAVALVKKYGYWQILLVTVLFILCAVRSLRTEAAAGGRNWRSW